MFFKLLAILSIIFSLSNNAFCQEELSEIDEADKNSDSEEIEIDIQAKTIDIEKIDPRRFFEIAKIQILDKTTAKSNEIEIKVGEITEYNNIVIEIKKCWRSAPDKKPDSKILMKILEKNPSDPDNQDLRNQIFYGWMIASSPSISGLEHPVYDIVALNCKNNNE